MASELVMTCAGCVVLMVVACAIGFVGVMWGLPGLRGNKDSK